MKSKNGVLQFMSGVLFCIMSVLVLQNGLRGIFTGTSRWVIGIGFIIIGLLNIYESDFWKFCSAKLTLLPMTGKKP